MKALIIINLIIVSVIGLYAQNPLQMNCNGLKDGDYRYNFKNGNPEVTFTIKDGLLNGKYISYFKNGQIMTSSEMKDGHFHGESVSFFKNDSLYFIKDSFNIDTLTFQQSYIWRKNGTPYIIWTWDLKKFPKKPVKHQLKDWIYPDSRNHLRLICKIHGLKESFDENGNLISKEEYLDGRKIKFNSTPKNN